MKSKLVISGLLCSIFLISTAQEKSEVKEKKSHVKIVIVDDDGNKKTIEKDIDSDMAEQVMILSDDMESIIQSGSFEDYEMIVEMAGDVNEDGPHQIIIKNQTVSDGPFLGIHMEKSEKGILISKVVEGSGAADAGLLMGDVLVKYNDSDLLEISDLQNAMSQSSIGDKVKLTYLRDGKTYKTNAILGEQPERDFEKKVIWIDESNSQTVIHSDDRSNLEELKKKPFLGITPVENPMDIQGVMVFEVIKGSSAERIGLQTGDVIYDINGNLIESFDDLVKVLKEFKPGDDISVKYKRDGVRKETKGLLGNRSEASKSKHYMIKEYSYDSDEIIDVEVTINRITEDEMNMLSKKTGVDLKNSNEMDDVDIMISPNPNDGSFELEFTSPAKERIDVMVFDLKGNEVFKESDADFNGNYKKEISLKDKSTGSYFLIISQGNSVLTEKIVVQ